MELIREMDAGRTDKLSVFASVALHGVLLLGLVLGLGGAGTAPGEVRDHIFVELGAEAGAPARAPVHPAEPETVFPAAAPDRKVLPEELKADPASETLSEPEPEPVLPEPEETAVEVIETAAAVPVPDMPEEISHVNTVTVPGDPVIDPNSVTSGSENPLTAGVFTGGGIESDMGVVQAAQRELRLTEIRSSIQGSVSYPALARKRGLEGEVLASFLVGPDGMPLDVQVLRSSGYRVFDREVVRVIHAASPYPAVDIIVEVPVMFRLTEGQR